MNNKKYIWKAECNDGGWYSQSKNTFDNKKDCYNDMRDAALEKMKWNTEYDEDYPNDDEIGYEVMFRKNEITHESYSGVYRFWIEEV